MIAFWSGSIATVPEHYGLCNGTQGTPDLRDRFVPGAGGIYAPGNTGGTILHTHDFTGDGHSHTIPPGTGINAGVNFDAATSNDAVTGTTDSDAVIQLPYYALAYIMRLN